MREAVDLADVLSTFEPLARGRDHGDDPMTPDTLQELT
jgi:hypothetical protein